MRDIKKDKLLQVKSYILRMANNKKKSELIDSYCRLLQYYCELKNDDSLFYNLKIDKTFAGKYEKHVISDTNKIICDVSENANILYDNYQKIIDIYKNNDFCSYECNVFNKTNIIGMAQIVYDFFASLGDDVLKVYINMLNNNNIFLAENSDSSGFALNTIPIDYPCIVVENFPEYLQFYSVLVHEIGHCYQFYLQRNHRNMSGFDPYIEITSLLFERLFVDYLKKNHVMKDTLFFEISDHVYFLNDVSISKALTKLFIDRKIKDVNAFDLSYNISVSKDELIKEIALDCGHVLPNRLDLNLDEFHYSISNIIAIYFHDKLKNNFDDEWKNFKDFICTMHYLPMNEIIGKYFDISLIRENINIFIKSYRGR